MRDCDDANANQQFDIEDLETATQMEKAEENVAGKGPPAMNCQVSQWGNFAACSKPCGKGSQTRNRSVEVEPSNGGTACPKLSETRECKAMQNKGVLEVKSISGRSGKFVFINANSVGLSSEVAAFKKLAVRITKYSYALVQLTQKV